LALKILSHLLSDILKLQTQLVPADRGGNGGGEFFAQKTRGIRRITEGALVAVQEKAAAPTFFPDSGSRTVAASEHYPR